MYKGDKEIVGRFWNGKEVQVIYYNLQVIWELISSCFGSGVWKNLYPFKNTDAWKNN